MMVVVVSVTMMSVVAVVVSVSGQVGVHVFGARDDVREALKRTVPFLFGGGFACAVEEHAEAAR